MGTADLDDDRRVCLVATRPATFEACREGYYPCPASYARSDADVDALACYRTAPVSAVTHYAPIERRVRERRPGGEWLTPDRWADLLDPVADTDEATVFELGELRSLDTPVAGDGTGVRGAWYVRLGDLRASESLTELRQRMDRE